MSGAPKIEREGGRPDARSGFTLMELMVVLSIIAVLVVLVSPTLWRMFGQGETSREKAVIQQIRLAVKALQADANHGDLPPTFLDALDTPFEDGKGLTPNRVNCGIESLVAIFHSKGFRGETPFGEEDRFINADDDTSKTQVTEFGNRELFEYADSWGTPLVYMRLRDFEEGVKSVEVSEPYGEDWDETDVRPRKNGKLGIYYGSSDGFQIISAGPDRVFDTDDDLTSYKE